MRACLVTLVLSSLAIVGCGGDDDESAATTISTAATSEPSTTSTSSTTSSTSTTSTTVAPPTTTTSTTSTTTTTTTTSTTSTTTTTLPPAPTGDSCPGGDYSGNPNDGSCSAPTTLAPPPVVTPPPAPVAVLSDAATSCRNDTNALDTAVENYVTIGTPPGGLTIAEWAAQKWAADFTPAADGSYTISAWLPGNPIYDDTIQLSAMQCLIDRLQTPAGVRSSINAPALVGTTQSADWQVGAATLRVQWDWDADSVLTIAFWQD